MDTGVVSARLWVMMLCVRVVQVSVQVPALNSVGYMPGIELLGHTVVLCLTLQETVSLS